MGINMNEAFPSKWLKASDISSELIVTITNVTMEDVGDDDRKPVVWFREFDKGMVLNKTNANNVTDLYGPDSDMWLGKAMVMATAMVDFQGKSMRALRLYPPPRNTPTQGAPLQPQKPQQSYGQASGHDDRNPPPVTDNEYANNYSAG